MIVVKVLLDLYAQCLVVQAALRVQGCNLTKWDGIGQNSQVGYLLWSDKILQEVGLAGLKVVVNSRVDSGM